MQSSFQVLVSKNDFTILEINRNKYLMYVQVIKILYFLGFPRGPFIPTHSSDNDIWKIYYDILIGN